MKKQIVFLLFFSVNLLFVCNGMKDKKYKFDAYVSVPSGYSGEAIPGGYVGEAFLDYGSYLQSTWGGSSSVIIIGDGMHPFPDGVRVRFYSYVDDKFYKNSFYSLPQERVKELLEINYKDNKGKIWSFSTFEVSIAPDGWVTVWLSGSAGQREICSFQADEVPNWDFRKVFPEYGDREEWLQLKRSKMYSFVQQEIAESRVPYNYWKRLSKKYKWKLVTNDCGFKIYDYSVNLINIERYYSETDPNFLSEQNQKAIPKVLFFLLRHDKDPLRYKIWIELVDPYDPNNKDKESQIYRQMVRTRYLMDLFDKFYAEAGDEEVSLLVEFNDAMTDAQVKLKTAIKEQIIEGCRVRGIWDSDSSRGDW